MGATKIYVRNRVKDTQGELKRNKFKKFGLSGSLKNVHTLHTYTLDVSLNNTQVQKIAHTLTHRLTEDFFINKPWTPRVFDWVIEIGFHPGVTDNVGNTVKEEIEDYLKRKLKKGEGVYSSKVFYLEGKLKDSDVEKIKDSLHNPLIERALVKSKSQFKKDKGIGVVVPKVILKEKAEVTHVNLDVSDEELIRIGKQGIENKDGTRRGPLAMSLQYMKAVQEYFKKQNRKPTDIELESIAQTWSEHCKHTIFANPIDELKAGLYKGYIQKATNEIRKKRGKKDFCYSVFKDNSGAIEFDDEFLVTHKVETHNSPSALDPFGGSITGIVGVNRDTIGFGLGAKPITNIYGFCFADPKDNSPLYKDKDRKIQMLSPNRIMEGVIEGVNVGGNCSGIPTPQGFMLFDTSYKGKPLVFVGTVGLIPKKIGKRISYEKKALPGDYVVVIGGRVGQDGIHGATFSSEEMSEGSPATAVQIGDPITQKKLSDAIVKEARDKNLYSSITDNGAGGISCSVAEMAKESGGCRVNLEKVPLKYPGLAPWQIWISESQERMTLSVPKNKWKAFKSLMDSRGVEATIIGEFTKSGRCEVFFNKKKIMDIDLEFLHDGLPEKKLETKKPKNIYKNQEISESKNLGKEILELISEPNIASTEFVSSQYDHEVQASSLLKPLQGKGKVNGEVSAIKPLVHSKKAVILSQGLVPQYSPLNPYDMASSSIDSAVRNVIAAGGDLNHLAILDNFCWCSSNDPERLWQLKEAVRACYDVATTYNTPFISGKDSMFNDFSGYDQKGERVQISVLPTLLVSAISVASNFEHIVSLDPKVIGDSIYIIGKTNSELGGSEYVYMKSKKTSELNIGGRVPKVNLKQNLKNYSALSSAIKEGLIASSISVTRGGLSAALSKMAISGKLGIEIDLAKLSGDAKKDTEKLFSESQGRIIVTINPSAEKDFLKIMKGSQVFKIGKVIKSQKLVIKNKHSKQIAALDIDTLDKAYRSTFKGY